MKENKYDDETFFAKYSLMDRSQKGLAGAGEWATLQKILPDLNGKHVLDLGCGFGWHCHYAIENGAATVTGTDISEKMLERARVLNGHPNIKYICQAIEDMDFASESFDIIISSLALHYIESFEKVCLGVKKILKTGGYFIFSGEHPVFTAQGDETWYLNEKYEKLHWPIDNYFMEGKRETDFLGEKVIKYHRTLSTYLNGLLKNGFVIQDFCEPTPTPKMLRDIPDMKDELRRPMMFIASARKI